MKRILALLLALTMLLSLAACGGSEPTPTAAPTEATQPQAAETEPAASELINNLDIPDSWKQELLLADYMGIPMDDLEKETITGVELAALLDAFVTFEAPDRLTQWQSMYPVFRAYSEPLPRIDVQSVLFLVIQFIGGAYADYATTIDTVNQELLHVSFSETDCPIWELYGEVNNFDNGVFGIDHFGVGGTFYNNVTVSPVSGEQPLAYDAENNAYHMTNNATYLDGVMAIARAAAIVHEDMFTHIPSAEEQVILDNAEARKAAILNTESDWTLGEGGTVYYVSPDGDDSNDGLSPETAWKSLGKINSAAVGELNCSAEQIDTKQHPQYQWAADHSDEWITLKPGDVVLFERGGLWRGGLMTAEGVTYSAYGDGAKPEIWGSPENGSGAEKWSLLEGTDNIWVFYREIQECGGILLDGETVATKYAPFWDESTGRWLDFMSQEPLPVKEALACPDFEVTSLENLNFFNELCDITSAFPAWCWGKLYLRCDAGNPGEVYDSIEFFTSVDTGGRCVQVAEKAILDNISVKYFGSSVNLADGATVRNCWVEYCGGIVQEYNNGGYVTVEDNGMMGIIRCGECITAGNSDTTVVNTYIAYAYDHGVSVENGAAGWVEDPTQDYAHRNVNISGNLLEYNAGGLNCLCWDALAAGLNLQLFENVSFADNYVMYTGMGWSHAEHYLQGYTYLSSAVVGVNPGNNGQVHFVDNVFYDCWDIGQLVWYQYFDGDIAAAEFRNNTYYVANAGARAAEIQCSTVRDKAAEQTQLTWLYANNDLAESLAESIGDTEAKVITKRLAFVGQ